MNKLGKWLPVFLWAAVIFTLSSIEQTKVSNFFSADFFFKKLAHITEYAILFGLIFRATNKKWLLSFAFLILYAISDEVHQGFVPGRIPSLLDIGIDISGANIAAYILWKFQQKRQKKRKKSAAN